MGDWISVKDRLPPAQQKVLFWCARNGGFVCFGTKGYDDDDSNQWFDEANCDRDGDPSSEWEVTHWMPLPEPPTEGGGNA